MMHTVCGNAVSAGSHSFVAMISADEPPSLPQPPPDTALIAGPSTGFLVNIDEDALASAAVQADALVFVIRTPGG